MDSTSDQLLVTRGSSEAIDVLIRGFCRAGRDGISGLPADVRHVPPLCDDSSAAIRQVPLLDEPGLRFRYSDAVLGALDDATKIVFVCSPNNPTGQSMRRDDVETICRETAGRALLVDRRGLPRIRRRGRFLEFREKYEHVVLLRTLSKFVSLAGVRCGVVVAAPEVVEFLQNVLPPYTFPTPSIELVLEALSKDSLRVSQERVILLKRERERLAEALLDVPQVLKVYPSDANFVLVRTLDGQRFRETARRAGILVRTFR